MEIVIEKLHNWNFPELTELFLRNEIDIEAFNNLTEENIKELIPKLGVRINFLNKYRAYKKGVLNETISDVSNDTITQGETDSDESIKNTASGTHLNKSWKNDAELNTVFDPFQNLHINHVLRSTYQGRSLILHYAKNKELGRTQRKQLVDLILNYICQFSSTKFTLTNENFETIAEKIVTEFPTEIGQTYYVPPVRKVKSKIGKSEPARGKLVDRYRNIKYKLQKSGVIHCRTEQDESTSTLEMDVRQSLEWLQTRNGPWDEVLNHWKKTHPIRAASKLGSATEFLEEWPLLRHCNGPVLIDVDFEIKYSKYVLTLEKLNYFFEKLLSVRSTYVTDKQAIASVELLKGDLSRNTKVMIQLELLSHLIPPRGRTRSSGIIKKPSIAESTESIIIKVDSSDEVEPTIERKRLQQSGPVRPYIITDKTSGRAFVVIDVVRYSFENVLRAFETAFKAFHVMNIRYPPESQHIWYVLQVALFKVETCWDRPIPYVMDILSKF